MKATISRRQLLAGLGLGAATPLVPLLDRHARAAAPPRRLLLVFSPNGSHPPDFWPEGGETDFSFRPGSILEPLTPHRKSLIIPRNLKRVFHSLGGDHERGIGCLWTGAKLNPGNQFGGGGWPSAPSIDQIIGKALPLETRFRTLEAAVQNDGPGAVGGTMLHMSYAGSEQPIPPENSPYKLFDRFMGPARPAAELDRVRVRKQSVLDVVKEDLRSLQTKLDAGDRGKVEGHLEAIRSIETRLQKTTPATASCPTRPDGQIDVKANDSFPALVKLQSELVASAFACDLTRVATLQWSRAYSMVRHRWVGVTTEHHPASHDATAAGNKQIAAIHRWYAQQFAQLLDTLAKVPEAGGTLLDNTLVVWAAELSYGATHEPNPPCAVLAGGLGGRVRTGRYLDFKQQADWTQLLVTICRGMGVMVDRVGDLGQPGVVPGLLAAGVP